MRCVDLGIRGWGEHLPGQCRTVSSLAGRRVTVREASDDDLPYAMATAAAREALARAELTPDDLEGQFYLNCNEGPADYLFQLPGRMVLDNLGVDRGHTYNFTQGCDNAIFGMYLLACHLMSGTDGACRGLVAAPSHWRFHSRERRLGEAVLSDGAACILLERGYRQNRLLSVAKRTDVSLHDVAFTAVGGTRYPLEEQACRDGEFIYAVQNEVAYRAAVASAADRAAHACEEALLHAAVDWNDLSGIALAAAWPALERALLALLPADSLQRYEPEVRSAWSCSASVLSALGRALSTQGAAGDLLLVTSVGIDGNCSAAVVQR